VRRPRCERLVGEQQIEPSLVCANQEWAMDFIVDALSNGRISFNGRLRNECLNVEWFGSLHQAREKLASGAITTI
jgi:hypothetical protein